MTDQKQPAGPNELHPIRGGMDTEGFEDFRAKAPVQTAFEQHLQNTAFTEEQRAKADAESDAEALFGDREPVTAFELEMSGGRRPLDAPESAQPSLFDQTSVDASVLKELQGANAFAAKESKSSPTPQGQTKDLSQPSASPRRPGPSAPSV